MNATLAIEAHILINLLSNIHLENAAGYSDSHMSSSTREAETGGLCMFKAVGYEVTFMPACGT